MNIREFHNDLQATLGIFLLQIDCRVWFDRWSEIFRFRLLGRIVTLDPQIVGPVAEIEGPECHIPQWNGSIDYAFDEWIKTFVSVWMKVVDVTRDPGDGWRTVR